MRKLFFLFLVFYSLHCFSQTKEITILFVDADTLLPVEEVTVTSLRTKENFVSNVDGIVKVVFERSVYLEINHSSYKKFILKTITLKDEVNTVYLESTVNKLPEIILTKNHPQDILQSLVDNSKAKLSIPSNLRIYIREFFKKNDANILYNDGLVNFQIERNKSTVKTDILIEQNRVLGILDEKSDNDIYGYNLNDLMENYYQFKYLDEILTSRVKDKYNFQINSYPENENYYRLTVSPLEEEKGFLFNFSILYDHNKRIIIEINNFISPERAEENTNYSVSSRKNIYKSAFKTTYRVKGNDYYLVYAKEEIGYLSKKKEEIIKTEIRNYFVTSKFTTRLFTYDPKDVFKDKTLLNRQNTILTDFWNIESGLLLTQDEQDFIDSLSPPPSTEVEEIEVEEIKED
ncbi:MULTISPECIES: hypothetical protein [Flavobacterium]|uniref:CarboxypepD_reg-like domain-containing protein n=1 Tax=Flavobacterium jumunjinense TaxID=998845 RepID=A0ABV5GHR2_9FLAO|nr:MULTISPECIES: hypothetical protein [Flavobacterium]